MYFQPPPLCGEGSSQNLFRILTSPFNTTCEEGILGKNLWITVGVILIFEIVENIKKRKESQRDGFRNCSRSFLLVGVGTFLFNSEHVIPTGTSVIGISIMSYLIWLSLKELVEQHEWIIKIGIILFILLAIYMIYDFYLKDLHNDADRLHAFGAVVFWVVWTVMHYIKKSSN